jgi:hypothetical protein
MNTVEDVPRKPVRPLKKSSQGIIDDAYRNEVRKLVQARKPLKKKEEKLDLRPVLSVKTLKRPLMKSDYLMRKLPELLYLKTSVI